MLMPAATVGTPDAPDNHYVDKRFVGRPRIASGGLGLVANHAVRQCLLEILYAFVGDLCVVEVEQFKLGQTCQMKIIMGKMISRAWRKD